MIELDINDDDANNVTIYDGDKLECIGPDANGKLKMGSIYTVKNYIGIDMVTLNEISEVWYLIRFRKI